ncbi:MFS transporter [Streptomyces sp. HUAS TT20]|uniref:MFS transporter n=1 Tax=Streptomyces sp. HUAS TT20 TaxID=3447509 RepID=UPI0021D878D4|nr:MFS transporter [Streptomyces sp. HUAS 15-9]UXY32133.1 MFS transporter [Streptomyces sp. HUAS 15-9]
MTALSRSPRSAAATAVPYDVRRLFVGSCIALAATGMTFSVRGDIMGALGQHFSLNHYQLGLIAGAAFYGYVGAILGGGLLVDALGARKILTLAFIAQLAGLVLTITAPGFDMLFTGTLVVGLGNGLIEAAANPLIASLYPREKTRRLNAFHAWFAGGLIVGGFVGYGFTLAGLDWRTKLATIILSVLVYGVVLLPLRFPATERVAAAVSSREMFRTATRPIFLVLLACMLLTASTELGPNQWMPDTLGQLAGASGILVLTFVNGIMFAARILGSRLLGNAGPIAVLAVSSVLAAAGLQLLAHAHSALAAYAAAAIFALGISRYWPTMLGAVAERCPKGGSFVLALLGSAGMLATAITLPWMGHMIDTRGAAYAFATISILPVLCVVAFTAIWLYDRRKGVETTETLTVQTHPA